MKRTKVFVFWTGVFAFGLWAAGAAAAGPQKGAASQVERGRAVYAEHCVRCHGSDGQGRTRMGETVEPPDLSDPAWQRGRGNARMAASVANGRGQMPAFKKKLSRQDIAASIAYVRTLKR
ncbi:MAG TPA: c-type cytochrome [Pyrinomonadaceae bacterium]|jgi:cbb3-type cytochrome c oxidase subunit III